MDNIFWMLFEFVLPAWNQKWQIRGEKDKEILESRKELIQRRFREQLGLIIDLQKPVYVITNDGNTAGRFFENSTISSSITGVNEILIQRFHVILEVIPCSFEIDVQKFQYFVPLVLHAD